MAGFMWTLVSNGSTSRRSGEEVGKEIIEDRLEDEWETSVAQKTAFKGVASSTEREVTVSFRDIKTQIRAGQWRQALPILLVLSGFLGLLLFGSLALLATLDNKLVGLLIAITAAYAVVRVLIGMIRA